MVQLDFTKAVGIVFCETVEKGWVGLTIGMLAGVAVGLVTGVVRAVKERKG